MVIRMRHTRAHTRNRRSHHGLETAATRVCEECGALRYPHTACANCGRYDGRRTVLTTKKHQERKKKRILDKLQTKGKEQAG